MLRMTEGENMVDCLYMSTTHPPLIGAHVSTQGGIQNGPKRAKEIGCNAVQIFSGSPQMWPKRPVTDEMVAEFLAESKKHGIEANVIHALYLVNLATEKPDLLEKCTSAIGADLALCAKIRSHGVVVHVGSHQGRGWESVREQVAREIAKLVEHAPDNGIFLIENAAGQEGKIGSDLREIRWLLDTVKGGEKLGWCIDSCHAYAAGYSFVPMEGEKYLFDTISELNLADALRVVHVNDSRDEYVSHKDRHANLLEGQIGEANLRAFLTNPVFSGKPFILEVPGGEGTGPDKQNVEKLRNLLS